MNTRFERTDNPSDEWYTPKEVLEALGKFDLDPCAPVHPLWRTAEVMYDKNIDGLSQKWKGRVWLNPPYSRPLIELFVRRLAEHGNGIALLFNRCDSKMFQDIIRESNGHEIPASPDTVLPSGRVARRLPRLRQYPDRFRGRECEGA